MRTVLRIMGTQWCRWPSISMVAADATFLMRECFTDPVAIGEMACRGLRASPESDRPVSDRRFGNRGITFIVSPGCRRCMLSTTRRFGSRKFLRPPSNPARVSQTPSVRVSQWKFNAQSCPGLLCGRRRDVLDGYPSTESNSFSVGRSCLNNWHARGLGTSPAR